MLSVHTVPRAFFHTLSKQLENQALFLSFLSNIIAFFVTISDDFALRINVDTEICTIQLFNLSDVRVFFKKLLELLLDQSKFLHHSFLELGLFLSVGLLKLFLHDVGKELHFGNWLEMLGRHFKKFIIFFGISE